METISFDSHEKIKNQFKVYKNDDYGANSTIYDYKNGELLKVFNNKGSINTLYTLKEIKNLPTKSIIKVNNFIKINNEFFGYTMNKVYGRMLINIRHNNIRDLLNAFSYIEEDINILTENMINIDDLNPGNMIYNKRNNNISIIDCDRYYINEDKKINEVKYNNFVNLYLNVLSALSNIYYMFYTECEFYNLMKEVIINSNFSNDIVKFFNYFIDELESNVDKKITSVDDFRKALKLTKKSNN